MERLNYRYTKDNDKELGGIAEFLAVSKPSHEAARIYAEIEELKNQMQDGLCHFVFRKVNGECRDAYGTRAADIISKYSKGTAGGRSRGSSFNGSTFPYFDLVRRDWRCFRVDSLLEMDRDYVV